MARCILPVVTSVLLLTGTYGEAATPHRRSAALDRLKRRSATARWDEIRKTWRFDHGDYASDGTDQDLPVGDPSTDPNADGTDSEGWGSSGEVGFTDEGTDATFESSPNPFFNGGHFGSPPPELPPLPAGQFVGQIEEGDDWNGNGLNPTGTPVSPLPKPITSILPYYDYSPNDEDPCETLCPRPSGCPEQGGAQPCPEVIKLPVVQQDRPPFLDMHVAWEPSNLFHNPLYFQDHALERYGHTHGDLLQPFVSVGKFGVQLIGMPYQLALHPPCERQYTLGWHRPGECVPYRYYLPPWNTKAAITAGAAYTGLIFLIP